VVTGFEIPQPSSYYDRCFLYPVCEAAVSPAIFVVAYIGNINKFALILI
jgi:hypothetical protein